MIDARFYGGICEAQLLKRWKLDCELSRLSTLGASSQELFKDQIREHILAIGIHIEELRMASEVTDLPEDPFCRACEVLACGS
jgi:hypothetical protein